MIEWPSLGFSDALAWVKRILRRALRSRQLRRRMRVAKDPEQ